MMNGVTTKSEGAVTVRPLAAADAGAIVAFARALPSIDLLFLQRDIRIDKVVSAWVEQHDAGQMRSLVAYDGDELVGCAAVVGDALSWSPHVAEIRVIVAAASRGSGIGRRLAQDAFQLALADGIEKLIVRIVPEQQGAIALFEEMGFRTEAMLLDHVRDAEGTKHDIAIMSLDVLRQGGQHAAYGLG